MKKNTGKGDDEVSPEMLILDRDFDGNEYLEGMKPQVVKAIHDAVVEYEADKVDHKKVTDRLAASKLKLATTAQNHKSFFTDCGDGKTSEYNVGGIVVVHTHNEKDDVKTRKEAMPPVDVEAGKAVSALTKGKRGRKTKETPADIY